MKTGNENHIIISNQSDVNDLIESIIKGSPFAAEFKFTDQTFLIKLLESLNIDYEEFVETYYHFDHQKQLHISESEFGFVWISTSGLVARDKPTSSKEVNACKNQYVVLTLLLDKAIETSQHENVFDVDGYHFGSLRELSPALFHNILFYIEVFCKAYLALSGSNPPMTHKISDLYQQLVECMHAQKHNNSLFQVFIVDRLANLVNFISTMPGNFKESYVKYDDNEKDTSVIIFNTGHLFEQKKVFEEMNEFIKEYFHMKQEASYLTPDFYQQIIKKAKNEDDKVRLQAMYGHLIS